MFSSVVVIVICRHAVIVVSTGASIAVTLLSIKIRIELMSMVAFGLFSFASDSGK